MSKDNPEMTAQVVLEIVKLLSQDEVEVIIDGGWGVDALLGKQTRTHRDLDLAVMHRDVPRIRALLEAKGYQDVPRDDSWECNFVLGDGQGHLLDLHSCTYDEGGNNVFGVPYPYESLNGRGSIDAHPVRCVSAEWMVKFHMGYTLDENDYHDVKLLCEQFGIEMPDEYHEFALRDRQTKLS